MRIVTRPDFDGIVCAVILYEALDIKENVYWVEPNEIQKGKVDIREGDIIANLPYNRNCSMWFDHHYSNRITEKFSGFFKIAPSAAGIVYTYFKDKIKKDFSELIKETDRIDSADLTHDEVVYPEKYPYIIISMTIQSHKNEEEKYWNHLINLLRTKKLDDILKDPMVKERCDSTIIKNKVFKQHLLDHTVLKNHVAITDFRSFNKAPSGNRFLAYSLFPKAVVSVKIRYEDDDRSKVIVSIGHSIFNRKCNVNVGLLLSKFEGGGHKGAGACSFHVNRYDEYMPEILNVLQKNKSNEE